MNRFFHLLHSVGIRLEESISPLCFRAVPSSYKPHKLQVDLFLPRKQPNMDTETRVNFRLLYNPSLLSLGTFVGLKTNQEHLQCIGQTLDTSHFVRSNLVVIAVM